MPNDFMNGNNAGSSRSISLNLDALGNAANQAVNFGSKGDKPVLDKEVEAEVIGTDFRLMNQLNSNQNDPSKKYFNTILAVETKFSYTVKDENGNDVVKETTSRDNYSGLRFFPELDDNGNVVTDDQGNPVLERLWCGDTSAFGRLFITAQEYDSNIRSYSDFFSFLNKEGLKCMIKTEYSNYKGAQTPKEFIQSFI